MRVCHMRAGPHQADRERAAGLVRCHLLLQALRVALIGQHLLLLESFLREADLHLDDRTFVDNARPRLTLIDEELVPGDLYRLALLQVAHQAAEEVRLQDLALDQLD